MALPRGERQTRHRCYRGAPPPSMVATRKRQRPAPASTQKHGSKPLKMLCFADYQNPRTLPPPPARARCGEAGSLHSENDDG
jgi:hypothetical protein